MKKLAFTLTLVALSACTSPPLQEPTVTEKRTAAGTKYAAELLSCVDDAGSTAAADACAAGVRARWDAGGAK